MEFKHPKYYAELEKIRKALKKAQASGFKHQASDKLVSACADQSARSAQEPGAASDKPQAKK